MSQHSGSRGKQIEGRNVDDRAIQLELLRSDSISSPTVTLAQQLASVRQPSA